MKIKKLKLRFRMISLLVFGLIFARLIPHPPNFTPMLSGALLGGTYFYKKKWAYCIPIFAMLFSDYFLYTFIYQNKFSFPNKTTFAIYICILLTSFLGTFMRTKITFFKVLGYSFLSALLFFIITNFSVWAGATFYPQNFQGLFLCYTAGLPFFKNTLLSTFLYSSFFYGAFYFLGKKVALFQIKVS